MKVGWRNTSLADVCVKVTDGSHFSPSTVDDGYPYITVRDLEDGVIDLINCKRISPQDFRDLEKNGCAPQMGDVLFSKDGTVGKVALVNVESDFVVLSSLAIVRPKPNLLDSRYLAYAMQNPAFLNEAIGRKTGVAIRRVVLKNLKSIEIPLPPLDEQRRIVAVLDKAFAGIATATANAQKNLTNARALFEGYLDQIFGDPVDDWDQKTIGDIAAIKGGKRVPKGYKLLNEPTPYPYISVADFNDEGSVDTAKIRYISEHIFSQIKRYIIRKEDLYVSIAGTVGKTGIVPPDLDGASLTENACRLVFNKGVLNRFVYYFTLTSSFKEQAIEQTRTAAQPKLALSRLQQISLPIPPQNEQEQVISKFDDLAGMIRQTEAVYQRKLAALTELKQSLLHKAFAGELT